MAPTTREDHFRNSSRPGLWVRELIWSRTAMLATSTPLRRRRHHLRSARQTIPTPNVSSSFPDDTPPIQAI